MKLRMRMNVTGADNKRALTVAVDKTSWDETTPGIGAKGAVPVSWYPARL